MNYEFANIDNTPSIMNDFTTIESANETCNVNYNNQTMVTNICDDYQECQNDIIDTSNVNLPVCCLSAAGCQRAINITTVIDLDSFQTSVRCDGYVICNFCIVCKLEWPTIFIFCKM